MTVKGVTVYIREYQHHSKEAEDEWRVQDAKHGNRGSEDSESEEEAGKEEVPGEALWRGIREYSTEMDEQINKQEESERKDKEGK